MTGTSARTALRTLALVALPLSLQAWPVIAVGLVAVVIFLSPVKRRVPHLFPLALVFGAALLSAFFAGDRELAFMTWATWLLLAVALALLYTRVTRADSTVLALGFAAAAAAAAGMSWRQVAWLGEAQGRAFAFHPNIAAAAFTVTIGGMLVGWPTSRSGPGGNCVEGRPAWAHLKSHPDTGRVAEATSSHCGRESATRPWLRTTYYRSCLVIGIALAIVGLALTGSRSGSLGVVAGCVFSCAIFITLAPKRLLVFLLLGTSAAVGSIYITTSLFGGPVSRNLLTNSGFEHGLLLWTVNDAARVLGAGRSDPTETAKNQTALRLEHSGQGGGAFLRYSAPIHIETGQPYVVSVFLKSGDGQGLEMAIQLVAQSSDGDIVGRLTTNGWTTRSISKEGGYPKATSALPDGWQRTVVAVPPPPPNATKVRLTLEATGGNQGAYTFVDDIQLERGYAATAYMDGQPPNLTTFAQPVIERLMTLRDPLAGAGGRLGMWRLGLELVAARPVLGYGPGSELGLATHEGVRTRRPLLHFHSLYLKLLLEAGALFTAALVVWLGIAGRTLAAATLHGRLGAVATAAMIIALLVQSIFDLVLAQPSVVASAVLAALVVNPN